MLDHRDEYANRAPRASLLRMVFLKCHISPRSGGLVLYLLGRPFMAIFRGKSWLRTFSRLGALRSSAKITMSYIFPLGSRPFLAVTRLQVTNQPYFWAYSTFNLRRTTYYTLAGSREIDIKAKPFLVHISSTSWAHPQIPSKLARLCHRGMSLHVYAVP